MNSLSHWDPFKELNDVQNRISSLLLGGNRRAGEPSGSLIEADWVPAVDIAEDDAQYTLTADLPDIDKKDVKISVENGYLTISGERHHESEVEDKKKKYHRIERSYGRYLRSFRVPEEVDADKIDAKFDNGVLTVLLPKTEVPEPEVKEIPIS